MILALGGEEIYASYNNMGCMHIQPVRPPWFCSATGFSSTVWILLSNQLKIINSKGESLPSFSLSKQAKAVIPSHLVKNISAWEVILLLVLGAQTNESAEAIKAVKLQGLFELNSLVNCCLKLSFCSTNCCNFMLTIHIDGLDILGTNLKNSFIRRHWKFVVKNGH